MSGGSVTQSLVPSGTMTTKCSLGDDILTQAKITLGIGLGIGVFIGIVLSIIYCLVNRHLSLRGKQSTTSIRVPQRGAIQKQALQPPRQKVQYQTSNTTTISGVSDDQGEKNHRFQHGTPMLPKQSEAQQRGRNRVPAPSPDMGVSNKNNPSHNYNPYPTQHDEESEIYVNLGDQSQANDEEIYLTVDDSASSQQHARFPDRNVPYSNTNRHPEQHDEEPTYENLQLNSPNSEEYDYVAWPSVGEAMANQPQTNQEYLCMGAVPPRPPRR